MPSRFPAQQQYDDEVRETVRADTIIFFDDASLTHQSFAKDADLNTIVKRYGITDGAFPPAALDPRYFGDFTDAVDFREHLDRVRNATDRFNALPANIRAQFNNDPVELHDFVMNPANVNESVKMGLLKVQDKATDKTPPEKAPAPPGATGTGVT